MDWALDTHQMIRDFLDRGGNVLLVIVGVIFVMWTLILDRLIYLNSEHPAEVRRVLSEWRSRGDAGSWRSTQIYEASVSGLGMRLNAGLPMIKTLAALCPLLGLLGTVTGMIVIFDAVSVAGSGSARAVAGGVSTAIVTTMAGLVGALTGIFPAAMLALTARGRLRALRAGRGHPVGDAVDTPVFRLPRAFRIVLAPAASALITVCLLFVMEQMIRTGKEALSAYTMGYSAEFVRIQRTETVHERERRPERPPRPEEPPEWVPEAATAEELVSGDAMALAIPRLQVERTSAQRVGGFAGFVSDGDYLPILKVAPIYPRRAEERHLEGWVVLQFSLTTIGTVTNVVVVESSDSIFEAAAVAAATKFKYKPRVVNGEPVEVAGVMHRIVFDLPDEY